jgi:hypothetical protein
MNYKVLVRCEFCDRIHATGLTVELSEGPEKKQTVAGFFRARPLPLTLSKLLRNAILCRESGKSVMLNDPANLYLVPTSED